MRRGVAGVPEPLYELCEWRYWSNGHIVPASINLLQNPRHFNRESAACVAGEPRFIANPPTGNRFYRLKHIELLQTSPSCLGGGQERIEALARDQAAVCDIGVTRFPQLSQHLRPFR